MLRNTTLLSALVPTVAALVAATAAARTSVAGDSAMVQLTGTPEEIGTLYGQINAQIIRHDFEEMYLQPAYAAGLTDQDLLDRSAQAVNIIGQLAPHWLTEARAVAAAAGVDQDLYVSYIDGVVRDRFLYPLPDCTSYAVSPDYTEGGAILFHKTRDNRDSPQSAYMVDSSLPDVNKFIAVSNGTGIHGISMMVNEKGLAGCADYPANLKSGVLPIDDPLESHPDQYRGIMAATLLRHVAERAETCQDALDIITDCVSNGWYAGGDVGGNHWLFVDKYGDILEVRNNPGDVTSQWRNVIPGRKAYFSRFNDGNAADRLNNATEPIDFHLFHNVSRNPSICLGSSISGITVEIDPDHPELFTTAWVSLPVRGVAFPLLMGQTSTPRSLLDGEAYRLGKNASVDLALWESIEEAIHQEKEDLLGTADPADPDLPQTLDDWSRKWLVDVYGRQWAGGQQGGTWSDPGNWAPSAGTVETDARTRVTSGTAGTVSDDIVTVSPGSITLGGSDAAIVAHSLDASGGTLNLIEGTLTVSGGTFKPAPGDYRLEPGGTDTVVINLENQAVMDVAGYLRFHVGGTLNVIDSTLRADDFIGVGSASRDSSIGEAKLVVDGANAQVITGRGKPMWIGGAGEIGRVTVRNGGRIEVGDYLGLAKSTVVGSNGVLEIDSGGSVTVKGGDILIGTEGVSGQSAEMTLDGSGSALIQTGSGSLVIGAASNSTGRLTISDGMCIAGSGGTIVEATGTLSLEGGTLNTPSVDDSHGGTFSFIGGILKVKDFTGNLSNDGGVFAPGPSTKISSISGNYTQNASATIEMELSGTVPGTEYDHLDIHGVTTLGGTLGIVLGGGFMPSPDDTFDLFDYLGGVWGDFANYDLPDLGAGLAWDVSAVPTTGVLSVTLQPITGDLDGDGFVGGADLDIVRANWGNSVPAGDLAMGDPSGDGAVNSDDLDIIRANWGLSTATVVPEPGVLLLLAIGLTGTAIRRVR